MDEPFATETILEQAAPDPLAEEASAQYLVRWRRLVSTTNWEKGRIIAAWREALRAAGAGPGASTDDAWSRRVGSVSPQHVGRLRRVYERFGAVQDQYPGLYWSHFQAALDWPDAEMWLEGAVQSGWSISQMRRQRWQSLGAPAEMKPRDEDIIQAEFDEDAGVVDDPRVPQTISESLATVQGAGGGAAAAAEQGDDLELAESAESFADTAAVAPLRPFENLSPLPPDLREAFESFKLAILHHKISGWQEVGCGDVVAALESLKQLALAPGD